MKIDNLKLYLYYREYLVDHNLDTLDKNEIKLKLDQQLENETKLFENIVLYSYLREYQNQLVNDIKYLHLKTINDSFNYYARENMFEEDKKWKKMILNPNQTYKQREYLEKIYYDKLGNKNYKSRFNYKFKDFFK